MIIRFFSWSKKASSYIEKQIPFLEAHLGRWAFEFAGDVEVNAETKFYKNLARATVSVVEKDLQTLSEKMKLLQSSRIRGKMVTGHRK